MLALTLAVTLCAAPTELDSGGKTIAMAFSNDEALLAAGGDKGNVQLWSVAKHERLQNLSLEKDSVLAVAFSPDGKLLAAGDLVGHLEVFRTADGETVSNQKLTDTVDRLVFSPDGKLLALTCGVHCAAIFSTKDWKQVTKIDGTPVAWSGDGKRLMTYTEAAVLQFDRDGKKLKEVATKGRAFVVSAVSADAQKIVARSGTEQEVQLWNLGGKEAKELGRLKGHTRGVVSLTLSRDGARALTGSEDHLVKLWNVATMKELESWANEHATSFCTLSGSGHWVASTDETVIHLWKAK
jgi:WD40 repeat protein